MKKKLQPSGPDCLELFYKALDRLRGKQGKITFSELEEKASMLPKRGVYFIFDPNEKRLRNPDQPRCVRVGTHAVSRGSKSTLLTRLLAHRGKLDHGGSHRASVFRRHVGAALLKRGFRGPVPSWGSRHARPGVREKEQRLEEAVSRRIGKMQILWIAVPGKSEPGSDRSFIERNSIRLLNGQTGPFDSPKGNWLGRKSTDKKIRESGLWNVEHVDSSCHDGFLDTFGKYVDGTLGRRPLPARPIAPRGWASTRRGAKRGRGEKADRG